MTDREWQSVGGIVEGRGQRTGETESWGLKYVIREETRVKTNGDDWMVCYFSISSIHCNYKRTGPGPLFYTPGIGPPLKCHCPCPPRPVSPIKKLKLTRTCPDSRFLSSFKCLNSKNYIMRVFCEWFQCLDYLEILQSTTMRQFFIFFWVCRQFLVTQK